MFNIFLFLAKDVGVIDLPETLEKLKAPIVLGIIIVYGITAIRMIAKKEFMELIVGTIIVGFIVVVIKDTTKLSAIGDSFYNTVMGLLNGIYQIKESIPKNTGTELLIGFNLFAKMNPDPKNITEADNNRKQLQKNVVKKQNKDQKKIVKKGWI